MLLLRKVQFNVALRIEYENQLKHIINIEIKKVDIFLSINLKKKQEVVLFRMMNDHTILLIVPLILLNEFIIFGGYLMFMSCCT